jgi:hypothetical protein
MLKNSEGITVCKNKLSRLHIERNQPNSTIQHFHLSQQTHSHANNSTYRAEAVHINKWLILLSDTMIQSKMCAPRPTQPTTKDAIDISSPIIYFEKHHLHHATCVNNTKPL